MLYAIAAFLIFFLVLQFAVFLIPFLLPLLLIGGIASLFFKPKVKVYTYRFDGDPFSQSTDSQNTRPRISRTSSASSTYAHDNDTVIEGEYVERDEI